jgi:hypothetical protein
MGRKASRIAVSDVADAMQTVTDNVAKSGRRARKKAAGLAAQAAQAAGKTPKPRRRKRKMAVLVIILAGAGFAAKKSMAARSGAANGGES